MRYYVHQDRNWNVTALSEYDSAGTNNGRVVERYEYTPYGEFRVLTGDTGSGATAGRQLVSTVGNVFAHHGLPFDHDKGSYQNRLNNVLPDARRSLATVLNGPVCHSDSPSELELGTSDHQAYAGPICCKGIAKEFNNFMNRPVYRIHSCPGDRLPGDCCDDFDGEYTTGIVPNPVYDFSPVPYSECVSWDFRNCSMSKCIQRISLVLAACDGVCIAGCIPAGPGYLGCVDACFAGC